MYDVFGSGYDENPVPLVLDAKLSCYAAEFIDIKLIDLIALYTNRKIILIV
jgi:hypothetical protein